jgi:predicted enzyme related to lactoylglutathione lyase
MISVKQEGMFMAVKKSELSWITVSDWEKAKTFFTEVVGLEVVSAQEQYGWMELRGAEGGAYLGVSKNHEGSELPPGHNAVVTFTVDDIVATKADMEAKGVTFVGGIHEVPGQVKLALFKDSDGNLFHLVQDISGQQ